MTTLDPAAMLASPTDANQLQVFAAMVTATGPVRQQPWPDTGTGVRYLTPTGATKCTGLSVAVALEAFRALEAAGLASACPDNPERNGWRLNTDALTHVAQAASRAPAQ